MSTKDFFLTTLAVAIGGLIALAIAGVFVKQQLAADTAGNSTLGTLLNLVAPQPAAAS
jgi:hypothetical protein